MIPNNKKLDANKSLFDRFIGKYTEAKTFKEMQNIETSFVVDFLRLNANDWKDCYSGE